MQLLKRMVNVAYLVILIFSAHSAMAQTAAQNYIMLREPKRPATTVTKLDGWMSIAASKDSMETTISYFDGLGRPLQTVQRQGSPLGKDMVTPNAYDVYDREFKKYLTYSHGTATDGGYKADALTASATTGLYYFYNPTGTGDQLSNGVARIAEPFAETAFEPAPLNRVTEQGAPGDAWQLLNSGIATSGHTVKSTYGTNAASDIILWTITSGGNGATRNGYYGVGQLNTVTTTDENANNTILYKDKNDRVVARKVQSGASTYIITYYINDDIGNLRYVIPPLPGASTVGTVTNVAVSMPATSFTETDNTFLNYFYAYHYDARNRVTEKKIPGQGWQYIVYDKLDQMILSQDANQLSKGIWMVSKYDALGRVVMTGEYSSASNRSTLQAAADLNTSNLWESFTNATSNYGYTHASYPDISTGAGNKVLSATYYDTYAVISNTAVNPSATNFTAPAVLDTLHQQPRSLPTATLANILGTSSYIFTVDHYDTYGRTVKTISQNYEAGTLSGTKFDTQENQYNFQSLPIQAIRKHYLAAPTVQLTINNWTAYDHKKRPLLVKQQYISSTGNSGVIKLSKIDYNEAGQAKIKHLHSINTASNPDNSTFLQHIDYRYNPRGWLVKINDPTTLTDQTYSPVIDVFSEQIDYEKDNNSYGGTAQYNGNIRSVMWQTQLPSSLTLTQEKKGFTYTYDAMNRLTLASSISAALGNNAFNETLTYDDLGNILSLVRKNSTSATPLNSLAYNYTSASIRGNKLLSVTDNGTVSESQTSTFTYNTNGSIITDTKKMLTTPMVYNELNLPSLVTTSTKTIQYFYDATGKKLQRIIKTGATVNENRVYDDGLEYAGTGAATLEFINTPEGRAIPNGTAAVSFQYNVTDHLGNVRAIFAGKSSGTISGADIQQFSDYYAFGREITYSQNLVPSPDNKYKYNGKEYQQDLAEYDYGARFYDAVVGRWGGVDPLAETNRRFSPYNYVENNPMRMIDPDGMDASDITLEGEAARDFLANQIQEDKNDRKKDDKKDKKKGDNKKQEDKEADERVAQAERDAMVAGADALMMIITEGQAGDEDEESPSAKFSKLAAREQELAEEAEHAKYIQGVLKKAGRLGKQSTRDHNYDLGTELEKRGWTIINGAGRLPEEYLPPVIRGSRSGGSYVDITARKDHVILRINTIDIRRNGMPTTREATNASRIRLQIVKGHLVLIPKKGT
ncbi:DUF6443 domain-containing protein [Mucilaginibacter sp. L3T2-6]|uniref:DUF6443 domain-containing protein n=1 Tax=Mucilaginibacter sp. L3T2-6 TaxID=3062491 RepID=UPI002676CD48|nr:DUF6443 domain-containing protein [Mucilaginibacter sp. L3T2-6]MDO3645086.1 DUF6443 domain-containing protein [Mucilaginibacter sp. L3T2-6]MDV6217537.1 DUF6443 domain-containing protein [Mucilaginibacter sp. L3T2-6]